MRREVGDRVVTPFIASPISWRVMAIPESMTLLSGTARRWHSLDPLLPDAAVVRERGGFEWVAAPGRAGSLLYRTHRLEATDLGSIWREPCTATMVPMVGDGSPRELDDLLRWWREAAGPELGERLSTGAAYMWLPSRDTWAVPTLHRHGFQPHTMLVVRDYIGRHPPPLPSDGLRICPATLDHAEDVIFLWQEVIAYDSQIGICRDGEQTAAILRQATFELLARREQAIWMAELRGVPVGLCVVDLPAYCDGVAAYVRCDGPAYISAFGIRSDQRGKGIGRRLVAHVHALLAAAGHRTILLHHAVMNPLSAPFWARSKYRPLWAVWRLPAPEWRGRNFT
ncbi:GNAT family N-acetyltransferase [Nonomuraea sp. NPDC049714]|uniref:GNAT family N-acetyltransferase n=1 Tax=Nonomuraea sp. NPDC049714 TaxID=3364357 RepID=UPI0037A66797